MLFPLFRIRFLFTALLLVSPCILGFLPHTRNYGFYSYQWQEIRLASRASCHISGNLHRATPTVSWMTKDDKSEGKKYTKIEDGSPLGVSVVVLGSTLFLLFGDKFDKEIIENYAFPIIAVSASTAAGISRLIRNYKPNKDSS